MKLIIINGPCGVGKSTVSEKLHESMSLSFLLDIDAQRRFIGQRREYAKESGKMVLVIAQNILETCLQLGKDVIIDKMLFDQNVLGDYYDIAEKYDAGVHEIILWAPKEVVMKRASERGYQEGIGVFTAEKCEYFWDEVDKVKNLREEANIINVEKLTVGEVLVEINNVIDKEHDKSNII